MRASSYPRKAVLQRSRHDPMRHELIDSVGKAVVVHLPLAPSTNNLFINVPRRGRVPSTRYKTWRQAAGWDLESQQPHAIAGPVDVEIALPIKMQGDIDNRAKAPLDLLVTHKLIDDDARVMRLVIYRDASLAKRRMMIRVTCADLVTLAEPPTARERAA